MSFLHLFRWFSHTWLSCTMRDSTWGFAIVEVGHLLALAILGGTILTLDLRLLGLGLKRQPAASVAQAVYPLLLGSLTLMVVSGVLLVATDPMKYYESGPFRIKILLLVIGIVVHFVIQIKTAKNKTEVIPVWTRGAAILSLLLWLGVGVAGRAIGLV